MSEIDGYFVMYRDIEKYVIEKYKSIDELNNKYGFNYSDKSRLPDLRYNVNGRYDMIIDRI